jgi:23S rRNA pseudouridine1911/1915/1917 synthase
MAVRPAGKGKEAVTHFTVLERFRGFTLIEARLGTGRTHQIRVHLADAGHPVVGDETYRLRSTPRPDDRTLVTLIERLGGQALHAVRLGFVHPVTGKPMIFDAPLPERIERLLAHLRACFA